MPSQVAFEVQEEITADLLDTIPDVEGESAEQGDGATAEVHSILGQLRRDLEAAFKSELDQIEKTFGSYVADLETRLQRADKQLAHLAAERQRLLQENAQHEQRWETIRVLTAGQDKT